MGRYGRAIGEERGGKATFDDGSERPTTGASVGRVLWMEGRLGGTLVDVDVATKAYSAWWAQPTIGV